MIIRTATENDLAAILAVYDAGRTYMRANGNHKQWTNGYPTPDLVAEDIRGGHSFVCEEAGEIVGVFCYFDGPDPTYAYIEGAWLNDAPYGVIHRIAVTAHRRGVASACYDFCLARCGNLKVDTHNDNHPMQQSLKKNGFSPCGTIYLANGDPRIAFQKTV